MSGAGTKLGVGTHFRLDGETVEVVEFASLATGMEVVLKDGRDRLARMSLRALLTSDRAELIHDTSGPSSTDDEDLAAVVLNRLTKDEKKEVLERAEHVRECSIFFPTLTSSANYLDLRPSTLTMQLDRMECAVGAELFRRSVRHAPAPPDEEAVSCMISTAMTSRNSCTTRSDRESRRSWIKTRSVPQSLRLTVSAAR